MSILLKNGTIIDYKNSIFEKYDMLIENETIKEILKDTKKETIETVSKSAVAGGFTTICPMPNTKPTPDSAIILS